MSTGVKGTHCPGARIRGVDPPHEAAARPRRARPRHRSKVAQRIARLARNAHVELVSTCEAPTDPSDIERDETFDDDLDGTNIERA